MELSIIIPAHNEERRLAKTLESYARYFSNLRMKYEIIVVLNACKDRTIDIVKKYEKQYPNINHLEFEKGGKGFAVIEGFKEALKHNSKIIGFVDADMATPPNAFHDLVSNLNGYDGVIASRYLKDSLVKPKPTFSRILVSRIYNIFIRTMLFINYRDTQCGAKIFRPEALKKTLPSLGMSQWAFDVDLLYTMRKKGFNVKELPTIWSDKKYSQINFMKSGPTMVLAIIRLRLINSWLKGFVRVYDKFASLIAKILK